MKVLPIFLNNLTGRRCVVVGGGHEAERKAEELLACEAEVVLIDPAPGERLRAWAAENRLTWIPRAYQAGDLRDTFLVIVSETNPVATRPIWEEAQAEKVLINAMDDIPHCTFVAGSVVRRGPLVLSISTSGCAPALAVRMRQEMEATFGPEYATFLELMRTLREPMAARYPDFAERRAHWYALVDSDILDLIRDGRHDEARLRIGQIVGEDVAARLLPDAVQEA